MLPGFGVISLKKLHETLKSDETVARSQAFDLFVRELVPDFPVLREANDVETLREIVHLWKKIRVEIAMKEQGLLDSQLTSLLQV